MTLESRNAQDWTASFPEVVRAIEQLPVENALLDGEVAVVLLPDGRTSFQALQSAAKRRQRGGTLVYFVFDLLHLDGRDVGRLPLEERKAELEQLLKRAAQPTLRYSEHFIGGGAAVLAQACKLELEGIISKRRGSSYKPGRNASWLKIKCQKRQEFVVGGFTDPEGSRQGIGSLLIGYYTDDGKLAFAGKVGTGKGFTAKYTAQLRREFEILEQQQCPFTPRPPGWLGKHAHWVRPERIAEIQFTEWTEGGGVRHPSLQGFRTDKRPTEVRREVETPSVPREPPPTVRARKRGSASKHEGATVEGIAISSPERPVFRELGFTKLDLARFYADIAEWVLPHIADRPLTLVRCEKGVGNADALRSECKFLRHEPGFHRWADASIRRVQIQEQKKVGEYLVVDSKDALLSLVQGDASRCTPPDVLQRRSGYGRV